MCNAVIALLLLYLFGQLVTFELDRRATGLKITEVPGREAGKRLMQLAAISFLLFFLLPLSLPDDITESLGAELSLLYTLSWLVCPGLGTLVGIAGFLMYFAGDSTTRFDRFVLTETDVVATLKGGQVTYTISKQPPKGQSAEQGSLTEFIDLHGLLAHINSAAATKEARVRHKVNLQYDLDTQATERFLKLNDAFRALFACSYVWSIQRDTRSRDQLGEWYVRRDTLAATKSDLPFMTVDLEHVAFQVADKALLFLPDNVYSYDATQGIKSHRYSDVKIKTNSTEFTEQHYYVKEAPTLWMTWLHTRKDGGPDRRYKYNPAITRVVYGTVEIRLEPDVYWLLMVTSLAKAEEFCARFHGRHSASGQRSDPRQRAREESGHQRQEQTWPYSDPTAIGYYVILCLDLTATEDEVKAAYRRLAKMNHPDMVSGLDPQFRELAESRMKEINEAYDYIMKRLMDKALQAPG